MAQMHRLLYCSVQFLYGFCSAFVLFSQCYRISHFEAFVRKYLCAHFCISHFAANEVRCKRKSPTSLPTLPTLPSTQGNTPRFMSPSLRRRGFCGTQSRVLSRVSHRQGHTFTVDERITCLILVGATCTVGREDLAKCSKNKQPNKQEKFYQTWLARKATGE